MRLLERFLKKFLEKSLVLLPVLILLSSCGGITLGGGTGTNAAIPNGTVISQGNFTSLNGQTVTGAAILYNMGSSSYIVRLSGLSAPTENGLKVQVYANGTNVFSTPLQSTTGNQNYSFTSTSSSFSQVYIYSTLNAEIYGQALLQ